MKHITQELIEKFKNHLVNEEKSEATLEKYIRDISAFLTWLCGQAVNKTVVLAYKNFLTENYKPASVNSMLSSINAFFTYNEWCDCRVKSLKIQKQVFASKDKELTKEEYNKLLDAARSKKNERLYLLMQTICSTRYTRVGTEIYYGGGCIKRRCGNSL